MALHLTFHCDICGVEHPEHRMPEPSMASRSNTALREALKAPRDWVVFDYAIDAPVGVTLRDDDEWDPENLAFAGRLVVCPTCVQADSPLHFFGRYMAWLRDRATEGPAEQPIGWAPVDRAAAFTEPAPPMAPILPIPAAKVRIESFLMAVAACTGEDRTSTIVAQFQDESLINAFRSLGGVEEGCVAVWGSGPVPENVKGAFSQPGTPWPAVEQVAWSIFQLAGMMNVLPPVLHAAIPSVGRGIVPREGVVPIEAGPGEGRPDSKLYERAECLLSKVPREAMIANFGVAFMREDDSLGGYAFSVAIDATWDAVRAGARRFGSKSIKTVRITPLGYDGEPCAEPFDFEV